MTIVTMTINNPQQSHHSYHLMLWMSHLLAVLKWLNESRWLFDCMHYKQEVTVFSLHN